MTTSIRALTARASVVLAVAAGASFAFAPVAGASSTETTPVDDAVAVAAQLIYPDAVPEEFTAQERIEGFIGLNNYPGGALGSWGPDGGVGPYGQIGSITGPPPLATNYAHSDEGPTEDLLVGVTDLVFGPSEDDSETYTTGAEEPEEISPTNEREQPPGS